jgi:hypothetical protein
MTWRLLDGPLSRTMTAPQDDAMRSALKLHPESRSSVVRQVEADVARPRVGVLVLRYVVSGKVDEFALPAVTAPTRTDELWRHTCFEAFIRPSPGDPYYELNLAPSTQWAAYRFDGYRSGMQAAGEIDAPRIEVERAAEQFTLQATLQWDEPSELSHAATWRIGLSAVLEETSGGKSYWALAHPLGKPDFHHADCFVLELQ